MGDLHKAVRNELPWYDTITLEEVLRKFRAAGARAVWAKYLVRNNNSKNQIYVASHPNELTFLPFGNPEYTPGSSNKQRKESDKSSVLIRIPLHWKWIDEDGVEHDAPQAALSYYPQYPEVRLSGLIAHCKAAPSQLFNTKYHGFDEGRVLFLGVVGNPEHNGSYIVAIATGKDAPASKSVKELESYSGGRLFNIPMASASLPKQQLKQWIEKQDDFNTLGVALRGIVGYPIVPWRMRNDGTKEKPYRSPNAAGLTLEAELGVGENAIPGPDFDIWELKAYKVKDIAKTVNKHRITLFTPQPDFGTIIDMGQAAFVNKYGHLNETYAAKGVERYDFTTKDFNNLDQNDPAARMELRVFGANGTSYIFDGSIGLVDRVTGAVVAGWSFPKLLGHWQRKHDHAAYVPYVTHGNPANYLVEYGSNITLGISTNFGLFIDAFQQGKIVLDPAFHIIRQPDGSWKPKSRSQFRMSLDNLDSIYEEVKYVVVGPA